MERIAFEKWKSLSADARKGYQVKKLSVAQAHKLRHEHPAQYYQYAKLYQKQKKHNLTQAYKKRVIEKYTSRWEDMDLTLTDEARKMTQAVTYDPLRLSTEMSARTLAKQLHRLEQIATGKYKLYWSQSYMENYIQAVQQSFEGGEQLALKLRAIKENLSSDEQDILFSELPALNYFYEGKHTKGMAEKIDSTTGKILTHMFNEGSRIEIDRIVGEWIKKAN